MRMRPGVLWSAVALALLAVTSAQRRQSQVESVSRQSRRLPAPSAVDNNNIAGQLDSAQPTFRSRGTRRHEDTAQETTRSRSRSRIPTEKTQPAVATERPQTQIKNERFDSRRTRTRRPVENEAKTVNTFTSRDNVTRSRSRQIVRRIPSSTTPTPVETSSPTIDESKIEVINTNIDDITKITTKEDNTATTQFRRRSSVAQTTETVAPKRGRGRLNVRSNARSLDLDDSGTTNSIVILEKAPTTARTSANLKTSRKLRYRTRPLESDTNLTGEGIMALNEVKSSQNENITSQLENKISAPVVVERIVQQSTEANKPKTTTLKVTKVVRRPLVRKVSKATVPAQIKSVETEISDDDNYPESFKALIQAKNASTPTNSPVRESLSVKASQKVYKTYNASLQSTQTGPAVNKYSRRNKYKPEVKNQIKVDTEVETTISPEVSPRSTEYKPRGKYSARNINPITVSLTATTADNSSSSSEKPVFKYSRKFKITTTTQAPKEESYEKSKSPETNSTPKKIFVRPPLYSRKISNRNYATSTEVSIVTEVGKREESSLKSVKSKVSLPRTSYYARLRNNKNITSTTAKTTEKQTVDTVSENNTENSADMPLIFTLYKNPDQKELVSDSLIKRKEDEDTKDSFIINVSSTESGESMTANEVPDTPVEPEIATVTPTVVVKQDGDKQKYHANYKDQVPSVVEEKSRASSTAVPVRNIQSRKFGRARPKKEKIEDFPNTTTARSRDRSTRKFSESFSKTTEASNNGITSEPEKPKSRYSSKYRASFLDKPFYKPTVPTITSSTAWLKFFVTDHLLTKSVEELNWFEGKDLDDVTTESLSRPIITASYNHEPSSIDLVEGEEIQLGPDLNAIAITQTRRTLSSADLRLESLVKPSQVMNVEASHHSPSVTVSIFDALAEILTSTPKPRLSTTTEVTTNNLNTDVTQILNGVSNIVNVNSSDGIPSPDTFIDASSSTSTNSVQNTAQTVINLMSARESVTPSLNTEVVTPVNTPQTPVPIPSTPISARRPFAFKVLYSDTEPPTDKLSTAPDTSIQPTTDNPATVYNTVSDLLLSNNNLVSSELTSMLSNNIKSIIQSMDEDSRSRVSVDMAKLLRSLIPRALDGLATGLDNDDKIPNTTPYSLEDINDTANINIDVDNSADTQNIIQSVDMDKNVNSMIGNIDSLVMTTDSNLQAVNNVGDAQEVAQTSTTLSSSQTTADNVTPAVISLEQRFSFEPSTTTASSVKTLTSSATSDVDTSNVNNKEPARSLTNNEVPLPFLTNFHMRDFTTKDVDSINVVTRAASSPSGASVPNNFNIGIQEPTQVSPLQLWVLSKKAKVLQMIEDLIRQHNSELATAPTFTEIINPSSNNIQLSQRLTDIMNTMTFTTEATTTITNDNTLPSTTSFLFPLPLSTTERTSRPDVTTNGNKDEGSTLPLFTSGLPTDLPPTTTGTPSDISSRFGSGTVISITTPSTEKYDGSFVSTIDSIQSTEKPTESTTTSGNTIAAKTMTPANAETTTVAANTETTTQQNLATSTQVIETTTTSDNESTTVGGTNIPKTTQNTTPAAVLSVATPALIPKKDYVIFGILPNNTVVRKDPNDDILESLTEASPYIVYGLLPNNTVIRKFPNGTRVPRIMQKIDILPISPWSLRNPYSPIHNIPAIVRPQSNPIRVSTNTVTSTNITNNGTENQLTTDTVNNLQMMISPSALNIKSSSLGITTATNKWSAETSTASHVFRLRTTTMLPSIDEILLNSISSAAKQEMVISAMTSSTHEPRILTLDIDPETKQIRTEKPGSERDGKVFKFIPIDEVMVQTQKSNVFKLATKSPSTTNTNPEVQIMSDIDINTNTPTQASTIELQATESSSGKTEIMDATSTVVNAPVTTTGSATIVTTTSEASTTTSQPTTTTTSEATTTTSTTEATTTVATTTTTSAPITTTTTTTPVPTTTTTAVPSTTQIQTTTQVPTTIAPSTTTQAITLTTQPPTTLAPTTTTDFRTTVITTNFDDEIRNYQQNVENVQTLQTSPRDPKNLNIQSNANQLLTGAASGTTTRIVPTSTPPQNDPAALLQALFAATGQSANTLSIPNFGGNIRVTVTPPTTTPRSLEEDIRQFEEDTKLLKALLQATGQNPASLNIPSLDSILTTSPQSTTQPSTTQPTTTTTEPTTTTTVRQTTTTTSRQQTTTQSIEDDLKQFQEDAKLLQALLQATGQNPTNLNLPVISGITSNVRIASNPQTTSIGSNPTTPLNVRPVFSTTQSDPVFQTFAPRPLSTTLQPTLSTTEDIGISTTFQPFNRRQLTTTSRSAQIAGRQAPGRFSTTTEIPSTSTFSVEEDLLFLQNLKTVLHTNPNNEDPEAALANRIISLAVERSLTEIQSSAPIDAVRTGKNINTSANNLIPTTRQTTSTQPTTTSTPTTTTTTTRRPTTTTVQAGGPSIEDDIKQFQEDTKLLQALLKATGQDASKFNIPTLPNIQPTVSLKPSVNDDLKLLSNLLASPSPLNEPFDLLTPKPTMISSVRMTDTTTTMPFGAKIIVKDDLRTVQDDGSLIKTLIKLQGAQETTTMRSKLAFTGQTSDEALKKLIQQQQKSTGMVSEATKAPISLSTEYGKSNDALLAALLKEQGFGPTTASSLDEQLRLAALLNQVVVTPKARRTTTPPPPPPAPRRPILDGLAWLWQQWRETGPGPAPPQQRPNRPSPPSRPAEATTARANWFGSGPFVGNADDRPSGNRIPLEPPRAVASEQPPGRGQLVSAAINVTRAFSQFLGAAIQGAAQTVQSVIRAGQRAASDVYTNGSGAAG